MIVLAAARRKSILLPISTCHPAFVVEPVLLAGSRVVIVIRSESAYFPAGQKVPILCLTRVVDYQGYQALS